MMKNNYKVLIISCWSLLGICFLIKVLGGNWFELSTDNQKLINLCNWIDSNISKYFVMGTFYCLSMYLIYLSIMKLKIKRHLFMIVSFISIFIIKIFFPIIATILEFFALLGLPIILSKGKFWKRAVLGIVLMIGFQFISLVIRNIGVYLPDNTPTLISLLLQIDYYIMIVLYYLYSNQTRKER